MRRTCGSGAILWLASWAAFASAGYTTVEVAPSQEPGALQIGVTHTLWIAPETKTVRGIIVHQHGCGVGACTGGATAAYDLHWQELARKWDCALLGPSYHQAENQNCRLWCDPRQGSGAAFETALAELAQKSKHPEVARVPWCLWGHSGGGFWASLMQVAHPERMVAIWFQSGTAYGYWSKGEIDAPEIPAAAMQIPMMVNPGGKERDHERFRNAWEGSLAMFQDYRGRGAPIAFTPDPKSGHETRDSRYLAIPFFDACLAQRLPDEVGAAGPLHPMSQEDAHLASVPVDTDALSAAPVAATAFQGDPHQAVWLPNAEIARAWHAFIRQGDVPDATAPPAPYRVRGTRARGSSVITWQARADFESGIGGFEILRQGEVIGRIPETPSTRFGRPLFQAMSYHDTPTAPLPEMRFEDPTGASVFDYQVRSINSAGLRSSLANVEAHTDIEFAQVEGRSLLLDLYLPSKRTRPPLVVWIHGGGWRGGSKAGLPLRALLEHGYALASISYRFSDTAIFPAQLHDCKAAIRWLRAHAQDYGYRDDWIAVSGGSAGGHLALMLGTTGDVQELEGTLGDHLQTSSRVQAILDYYGPADFVLRGKTQPERAYTNKSGSLALLVGTAERKPTREEERFGSPVTYVTPDDPPLLILHGDADQVVLLDQSQRMAQRYRDAGLKAELIVLPGAGHGGSHFFRDEPLEKARVFLDGLRPR